MIRVKRRDIWQKNINFLWGGRNNNHQLSFGRLPELIDEIGEDIDFLILDTMHVLPGEILDFLAALPKLKDGAVVILHDIILNHYNNIDSIATGLLFSCVAADKLLCGWSEDNPKDTGIGVFRVTSDTRKYIENVFTLLWTSWYYMPDDKELGLYRNYLKKYYSDELIKIFDNSIKLNRSTLQRETKQKNERKKAEINCLCELFGKLKDRNDIFVYGCGYIGKKICDILERANIKVCGYVISDDQTMPNLEKNVEYISNVKNKNCTFVLAMNLEHQKEVEKNLLGEMVIALNEKILGFIS